MSLQSILQWLYHRSRLDREQGLEPGTCGSPDLENGWLGGSASSPPLYRAVGCFAGPGGVTESANYYLKRQKDGLYVSG